MIPTPNANDPLLANLEPNGSVPPTRLKDVDSANAVYNKLKQADDINARNRSEVQAMFDGAPPWDESVLKATGQGGRCNVNFGEADSLLEAALTGYIDLINSVENLVDVKTTYGDPNKRDEWNQIIATGFTKMLREWDEFSFKHILNSHYFVSQGVGICYWEDEFDWRWQVTKLGDFLIPRRTFASEEQIEIACSPKVYRVHELYQFIRDPKLAKETGWNPEEVKKAILECRSSQADYHVNDWERFEEDVKNNDLYYSSGDGSEVKVVHFWVREFDNSLSHYISLADGSNKDFLYVKRFKFKNACEAFVTFCYGIGTNGYYHSIRGLGYKIFPHIQISNRMRCQFVDGARLASSLLIQPESEDALQNLAFEYFGSYSVLSSGLNVVEKQIPNLAQNAMPVLNDMNMMLQNRTGTYQTQNVLPDNRERTKFEVSAQMQQESRLTSGALNLFYEPWTRLLRGAFYRATRKDYLPGERGGKQVHKFWKYCEDRGVPREALFNIREVRAVRAVGAGSAQLRLLAFDEFMGMLGSFDEIGRKNVMRDRVAARIGYDQADRYIPASDTETRPTVDTKIAELENAAFATGKQIDPQSQENHFVHASIHLQDLESYAASAGSGQVDPAGAVQYFQIVVPHISYHLEQLSIDQTRKAEAGALRQRMQQVGEIVQQLGEKVAAQQRKAQEEAAVPQQAAQQLSPEMQAKLQQHELDMKMKMESHQLKQQLQEADIRQKLALRDAETSQKIINESTKTAAKAQQTQV